MIGLAFAPNFIIVIISVLFIGLGSAVFHPEGAEWLIWRPVQNGISASDLSSGRKYREFSSSYFTALIFVPLGQIGSLGFTAFAAVGIVLLIFVSNWYRNELATGAVRRKRELRLRRNMRLSVHILNLLFYFLFFLLLYALGTVLGIGNFINFT